MVQNGTYVGENRKGKRKNNLLMQWNVKDISQWTLMNLVCKRSEKYKIVVFRKIEMTVWAMANNHRNFEVIRI